MKSQKHKPNFFLFLTALALMAFVFPSSLMIKSNSPIDLDQKFVFQHPYPTLASSLINESDLTDLHLSASFNEIDIKIVATGKTSGHIADAHIQNNLRKNVTVKIPTGEIPKDIINPREARQGFFVTEPLDFEIPGKTSIILPIRGYCNNPTLDPPAPGTPLAHPDKWDASLDDIQMIKRITTATLKIQKDGLINTPFSQEPEKERDIIIQQIVWVYLMEEHDPCQSIRQLLTEYTSDTGSDYEDYGVAQIMDAMRKIGKSSGLKTYTPPDLPAQAGDVQPPILIEGPTIKKELSIAVKGTGETTGYIADIHVTNPNNHKVVVRVGTSDKAESAGFYIPSEGNQHQPYIVPFLNDISVGPKGTVVIPVEGYCADIRRPPVPASNPMPDLSTWIALPSNLPNTFRTSDGIPIIHIPTRTALSTDQAKEILLSGIDKLNAVSIRPYIPNASKTGWNCPAIIVDSYPTFPGTDAPIVNTINPNRHLGVLVPVLLEGAHRIISATDIMQEKGIIRTPFGNNPSVERGAVIQQTLWVYSSALSGDQYPKKEFESNTFQQFENAAGQLVNNLTPDQKSEITRGVEDFWDSFHAVGAEAKILSVVQKPQNIIPEQKKIWQTYNKRRSPASDKPKMISDTSVQAPGDANDPSKAEGEEYVKEPCNCDNMTFDLVIRRVHPEDNDRAANLHNKEIKIENAGKTNKMDIDVQDWKQGDYYTISLMRGKMNCTCMNVGSAEPIICDFYSKSKNVNQKNKLKIEEDPSKRKDVESLDDKKGDRTDFKFTFSPTEPKSNVIKFCFSAYCFSDECSDSKSGVKCKDYCLELTFKEAK